MAKPKQHSKNPYNTDFKHFSDALKGYGVTPAELALFAEQRNKQASTVAKEETILDIAARYVETDRNKTYRHPSENFRNIKNLWNSYFIAINDRDVDNSVNPLAINEFDVSMLMVLMKVARLATNNTHKDSLIDIAGYARCAERVLTNK